MCLITLLQGTFPSLKDKRNLSDVFKKRKMVAKRLYQCCVVHAQVGVVENNTLNDIHLDFETGFFILLRLGVLCRENSWELCSPIH